MIYINSFSGIEHFVLVIQIGIVPIRKEYLVLVDSKKVEGRKKDFLFQNEK